MDKSLIDLKRKFVVLVGREVKRSFLAWEKPRPTRTNCPRGALLLYLTWTFCTSLHGEVCTKRHAD